MSYATTKNRIDTIGLAIAVVIGTAAWTAMIHYFCESLVKSIGYA